MNARHLPSLSANIALVHADRYELVLRVRCQRGYQCGYLRLRPGRFDATTLDCRMLELPSGKMVVSKAWDVFNHSADRMAVPGFRVEIKPA